ncbi:hypothetical protein RHMOL_Rhmol05G0249900 [Rhododendron molle]|uniref:Uncharacterized protein n=1 Tax=Rhododendron molle TaxID=49168 RepID=A0ACC0NU43_RHOML|nr:hypothetical protein RHMOL_Rhmol05G0249900 [Rhododendron molle]
MSVDQFSTAALSSDSLSIPTSTIYHAVTFSTTKLYLPTAILPLLRQPGKGRRTLSVASSQWAVFWPIVVPILSDYALYAYKRYEKQEKENIAAFEKMNEQETKDTISEWAFRKFIVNEMPKLTAEIKKIDHKRRRHNQPLKAIGSGSDSVQSPNPASRTPKGRSPKVVDLRSPRSPASDQKKCPSRVTELESQLAQLQEELKKAKDQLSSSESYKKRVEEEAEEAKKQLAATSAMLKDSRQQLMELSDSDDARVQEFRKISQERDQAWQSELEAVQKQQSMDTAALGSAMGEIQNLEMQLERVAESEAALDKSALDSAESRYQEEYIQSTLEIRSAYELAKHTKLEASRKEAELDSKLMKATKEIEGLKADLVAKETKLQSIFKENEGPSGDIEKNMWGESESLLEMDKKKFEVGLADLKASLSDKENELQSIKEENESMKFEIRKRDVESNVAKDEALASAESAKAAEREALMKLGFLTEEADKSIRKVARVTEQLDASQAANAEMEA